MAYIETVISLCTALIYFGALQIILTCFLAFAFSHLLSVLHCNVPTASGLLTGFITVPTVVQLRSSQISLMGSRKYGFTIWYKRLAIGTCTTLQTITVLLTFINLLSYNNCGESFSEVIRLYGSKQNAKGVVDNVQWFMQCCGSNGYKDWYDVNWGNFIVDPFHPKMKKAAEHFLLVSDTEEYPDLTTIRNDAVPFSCCAIKATSACVHQNLEQFGAYTINVKGCAHELNKTKCILLSTEIIVYSICLIIETVMMYHLCTVNDTLEAKLTTYQKVPTQTKFKSFHKLEKKEFSKFLNETTSTAGTDL